MAVGFLDKRLHVLCFTPRAGGIRVIRFRKANAREARDNTPDSIAARAYSISASALFFSKTTNPAPIHPQRCGAHAAPHQQAHGAMPRSLTSPQNAHSPPSSPAASPAPPPWCPGRP
ncbi:BrnT family toxin [Diaphorobacter limosus]|uniref:BrnT family toxin n=1 Tax=Diaphorobacter limosus TaxID=3036128 RepID=UPI0031F308E3